jgi:predicted metal-dependent phosphotriesterase family hydrolase
VTAAPYSYGSNDDYGVRGSFVFLSTYRKRTKSSDSSALSSGHNLRTRSLHDMIFVATAIITPKGKHKTRWPRLLNYNISWVHNHTKNLTDLLYSSP